MLNDAVFLGKNDANIDFHTFERPVHAALIEPLRSLKKYALGSGFTLSLASGYRSYERQLSIWNDKASGRRPVLDHKENVVDVNAVSKTELMFLMLRWSALPGASRHHWGTEVDVVDLSVLGERQSYELTLAETIESGIFGAMHHWLNTFLAQEYSDFYRPYTTDMGGVSPEPWHLSLHSVANDFERFSSKALIINSIKDSDLLLKQEVMENFDEIYERFVANVDTPESVKQHLL